MASNLNNLIKDLTCPITQELFEDPVLVPCCGKTFSKIPLAQYIAINPVCPNCRGSLSSFDPMTAPKNLIVAALLESVTTLIKPPPEPTTLPPEKPVKWSATLTPLIDVNNNPLPLAELKLSLENSKFAVKPTLFIAVVDRSGSMSGNPWKQVETALLHITGLTRGNPFVKTVVVAYDSSAQIYPPEKFTTEADAQLTIKTMFTGGGTNFSAAFTKVREVLEQHNSQNISSASVAFLTDGESGGDRNLLVAEFTSHLEKCWNGTISVHAIGFGTNCDRELLEGLRKIGPAPGTFRYAEPSDGGDTLCNKLTGLFEIISKSSSVPISLNLTGLTFRNKLSTTETQFPVDENKQGTQCFWVVPTSTSPSNQPSVILNSSLDTDTVLQCNPVPTSLKVFAKWVSVLIDELASDILDLSKKAEKDKASIGANVFDLACALIEQRCEAISACSTEAASQERVAYLNTQISALRAGNTVNMGKLGDLRFGSLYITSTPASNPRNQLPPSAPMGNQITQETEYKECIVHYSRNNTGKNRNPLQESICKHIFNSISAETSDLLKNSTLEDILHQDIDGNNTLMLASYCGQSATVVEILRRYPNLPLDLENPKHETAVTLAIKARGFWKTLTALTESGAKIPGHRRKSLEQFAINKKFLTTTNLLGSVDDSDSVVISDSMTDEYISFLFRRAVEKKLAFDVTAFLRIGVKKCMDKMVKSLVKDHGAVPTREMLCDLYIQEDEKSFDLFAFLLPSVDVNSCDPETGDSLLFTASEKGCLPQVKLLIEKGATVDLSNKLGNTPLWIACWKRYPCIINELLNSGADINRCNLKGNPPIVSICQKGPKKIAETLLARGATVNHLNGNGDSMILICCRNGQHEVLALLLNVAEPAIVNHTAHIDGFNAILASTEANRPECIQVLADYGVNLEAKTADDNPILAGATPLRLAAYYGRVEAASKLLSLGVNPLIPDVHGQTPLHIAVIQGNIPIIKMLRNSKRGTDLLSFPDKYGNTPCEYARSDEIRRVLINPALDVLLRFARGEFLPSEEKAACELLRNQCGALGCLSTGDALDITGPSGTTALMEAVISSRSEIVRTLLDLGASSKKVDSHGLSVYVWVKWINNPRIKALFAGPGPDSVETVLDALNNLSKAAKSSPGAAMILFLGSPPGQLISLQKKSHLGSRMSEYLGRTSRSEQVEKFFATMETSEASATRKNAMITEMKPDDFPTGTDEMAQVLETLKWQAKVFTTNMIASGTSTLTPPEIMALYMYNTLSRPVNDALIDGTALKAINLSAYIMQLTSGLNKLPPWTTAETFLGVKSLVDRSVYAVGKEIVWPTFMSATTMWRVATEQVPDFNPPKRQGVVFIIKSTTGRLVSQYSQFSNDMEVLFSPGCKFRVTNWYHGDVICLGQANIRTHTFKIKDEDLPRMTTTNSSLIIEMEQIV